MLVLTENATETIRTLLDRPDYPDTAGLRISHSEQDESQLTVQPTTGPGPDDQVIDQGGARVFVGPQAALTLDQMALDAQVTEEGHIRFDLLPQAGAADNPGTAAF
ncbi:MAG TPA: hypothetical protein VIL36_13005 [Acidimicrobiales bacterium]